MNKFFAYMIGNDGYLVSNHMLYKDNFDEALEEVSRSDLVKDCNLRRVVIERLEE